MSEWEVDPIRAARWGTTFPKGAGAAPHYLRCEYFNAQGQRCILAHPHSTEHLPPKEPEQFLTSIPPRSPADGVGGGENP